ncbi:cellulose 1,4-beta-cellobiosidase [Sarocladium strictum]
MSYTIAFLSLLAAAKAQQVGTDTAENHPAITWSDCTSGSCQSVNAEVVIDANWRWVHGVGGYENCYDGNDWTSVCSSNTDCAANCALEGATYGTTYGATTSGDALTLAFVTEHEYGTNIGSRFYLMENEEAYQMFTLAGNEFAFDVDLSTVECGINSALYFVAMEPDGGMSSYPTNTAGAKYGTGYCDAQCARDLKFIGGEANFEGWEPSSSDSNAGKGGMGSCCAEIDIWESNAYAYAFTPHACTDNNYHVCQDQDCGGTYSDDRFAGKCDANGCDYNPYRMGNTDFYGAGMTVDTSRPFTVVSQFGSDAFTQYFIQDGERIDVPAPTFDGISETSDITDDLCTNQFNVFGERDRYAEVGGWSAMQDAISIPMVLVMSIWNDHNSQMLWLDSIYPPEKEGQPGAARGPCSQDSGVPDETVEDFPNAKVVWSNIKFGPIGSTYDV